MVIQNAAEASYYSYINLHKMRTLSNNVPNYLHQKYTGWGSFNAMNEQKELLQQKKTKTKKNLFECSGGHLTIILKHNWKTVDLSFKEPTPNAPFPTALERNSSSSTGHWAVSGEQGAGSELPACQPASPHQRLMRQTRNRVVVSACCC